MMIMIAQTGESDSPASQPLRAPVATREAQPPHTQAYLMKTISNALLWQRGGPRN